MSFTVVVLAATAAPAKPQKPQKPQSPSAPCPRGMIEVVGDYCPSVTQVCLAWMRPEKGSPARCAEYEPTPPCAGPTVSRHFCIDKLEYPNQPKKKPLVMKTWTEARDICAGHGKRLCKDSEWTLACEGPAHLPYPYGTRRDASACNIDKASIDVDTKALANPRTRKKELARLWQGEASGSRSACESPYGVLDMTGNVDEWVINESGKPYRSGSKGGYWGRVRDACRPMTTAHGERFPFYQTGFRCCADPR